MPDPTIEGYASAPLPMPGARITSASGWRDRPGGRREWHEGADLRAAVGTPVLATRAGVVHAALPEHTAGIRGYGNLVVLWHPQDGLYTGYAHLSDMLVERGAAVQPGTVIAATGVTSGGRHPGMCPHLHFAVRRPRSGGRAPWPGAYPHPERAPWAHRAYWVDPTEYLRRFGLEPATRRGAGELRVRPGSAADIGGGEPIRATCPMRSPVVMAGGRVLAPVERSLLLAPTSPSPPPSGGGADRSSVAASGSSSCWGRAVLVGCLALGGAAAMGRASRLGEQGADEERVDEERVDEERDR